MDQAVRNRRGHWARWITLLAVLVLALTVAACGDDDDEGGGGGGAEATATEESGGGGEEGGGSDEPLVFANLEGAAAEGGADFTKGVTIAVNQINEAGGVNGRPIEVKTFKKGLTPEEATAAYRDAASDDSVLTAFLGGPAGTTAIVAQTQREELPIFQLSGRYELVNPPKPFVWSLSFDQQYPQVVIRYAMENYDAKKFAILHYETDYSSGITKAVEDYCKEKGCEVTTSQTGALDASVDGLIPLLQKMKDSGADVYYIETLNPNGPKAARQLGMFDKPVISEQWLSVPALAAATGKAGEDIVFAAQKCLKPELAAEGDPGRQFCEEYRAAYEETFSGEPYALFSVYGHDAVRVFAKAAEDLMAAGEDVTRENLEAQYEKFDGSLVTSHGAVESSPESHYLTGSFKEGYLLYELQAQGKNIDYTLAENADPTGNEP